MKIITKRSNGTIRVFTRNTIPSKTDQSFKNDCDVNQIMAKFKKTGQITHLAKRQGVYADVSEIQDLHESMTQVTKAQEAFDMLPAHLRERFQNSPVEMVKFLQNPDNDQEAVKLGLKTRRETTVSPESNRQGASSSTSPSKKTPSKKQHSKNDDDSNDDE